MTSTIDCRTRGCRLDTLSVRMSMTSDGDDEEARIACIASRITARRTPSSVSGMQRVIADTTVLRQSGVAADFRRETTVPIMSSSDVILTSTEQCNENGAKISGSVRYN